MEEYVWQCCRFCLSVQSLNPIFTMPEHKEKYTSTIYEATGVMVEINDTHPKQICTSCIVFINKSIKFRRKCAEIQKNFQNKVNIIEVDKINILDSTAINISHLTDDPFGDYDDNITLDTFQFSDAHVTDVQTETDANIEDKKFNIVDSATDISIDINIVAKDEPNNEKNDEFSNVMVTDIKGKVDNKLMDSDGNKRSAKRRMNDTKSIETKQRNTKEEIECEYCHKILTSKLSVRNHYKIHTGFDIVCEHCGKKFITRRLLLMHCRAKHGYEKTDKCSYCDYKASNAEQVKIHERLHTGEKPFVCKECNAGFHRKSSYLQHVAIHLPEKTVPCEQCPARFKSVTLMRIHASRHRAPRYAFSCGLCGGAFARRRNVARHLARVHASRADHHIQRHKIH